MIEKCKTCLKQWNFSCCPLAHWFFVAGVQLRLMSKSLLLWQLTLVGGSGWPKPASITGKSGNAANILLKRHLLPLTPDGSETGTGNSTKPRTILLKCHQECQEKRHTPPGTDSGASSSLPQRPGFVNNSPVDPRDNGILAGCHWQCCSRQPQSLTTTFRTEWKYRD